MSIPYDLIEVSWGDEILRARPIEWNKDLTSEDINPEEAEDVYATAYELVCPSCGGRCDFSRLDKLISCDDCGSTTVNPLHAEGDVDDVDIEEEPEEEPDGVLEDIGLENIEKDLENSIKGSKGSKDSKDSKDSKKEYKKETKQRSDQPTIEELLDNLTASISNTEVPLEDPDEEVEAEVEKTKKLARDKTRKKS